jgi:hypothetical protein
MLDKRCETKSMEVLILQEMISMMSPEDEDDLKLALRGIRDMRIEISEDRTLDIDKI